MALREKSFERLTHIRVTQGCEGRRMGEGGGGVGFGLGVKEKGYRSSRSRYMCTAEIGLAISVFA